MAKTEKRNMAITLRSRGESVKDIAKKLKMARSTASLWCREVKLTKRQIVKLHQKMIRGGYYGRLKGARMQYERRIQRIQDGERKGFEILKNFSDRDLLLAGISLYWGEGGKKLPRVRFCNSDPEMIKLMLKWFKIIWKVDDERFTLYVGINQIHKNRIERVEKYWSRVTKIPKRQFTKSIFIKAINKKSYKNFQTHYGTLTIAIKKSAKLYYNIIGLMNALITMAA